MADALMTQPSLPENEINLWELVRTVGKHKKKVIAITAFITILSIGWTLSKPNLYQSRTVIIPLEQAQSGGLGGLGTLAGIAGVELGGGMMLPDQAYQLYLSDYPWMREFLLRSKLFERMNAPDSDQNYQFALGYKGVYDLLKPSPKTLLCNVSDSEKEKRLFVAYKKIQGQLSIASDKKTSAITISYIDPDPVLAKEMVDLFLQYASDSLRTNELSDMEKKIAYYDQELQRTSDLALKTQLSSLMSALIQKKVLAQSSEYYNVKMVTSPSVAYERDKEGPKRGLIVAVSFVTSLILSIFGIFVLEFIRTKKEEE